MRTNTRKNALLNQYNMLKGSGKVKGYSKVLSGKLLEGFQMLGMQVVEGNPLKCMGHHFSEEEQEEFKMGESYMNTRDASKERGDCGER